MTPQEHYDEAEKQLAWAAGSTNPEAIAIAQVHATLATAVPLVQRVVDVNDMTDEEIAQRVRRAERRASRR